MNLQKKGSNFRVLGLNFWSYSLVLFSSNKSIRIKVDIEKITNNANTSLNPKRLRSCETHVDLIS